VAGAAKTIGRFIDLGKVFSFYQRHIEQRTTGGPGQRQTSGDGRAVAGHSCKGRTVSAC
jgi:hypothetical protein